MKSLSSLARALAVPAIVVLVGCSTLQSGESIVKYEKGSKPLMTTAPVSGEYALYKSTDLEPMLKVFLEQGAPLGFQQSDAGEVIAVAGDKRMPVTSNDYAWRRR